MPCLSPFMSPFMPMHPAYAAGRMPFMSPMMPPFFGQMPPPFLPPNSLGVPPRVPGPAGMFPFMPPAAVFPGVIPASLSTVASSVTPTSVVWAGVAHPLPSATVQSSSTSEVNTQSSSMSASSPIVTLSIPSHPATPPSFTSTPSSQAATAASALGSEGISQNTPVGASRTGISHNNTPVCECRTGLTQTAPVSASHTSAATAAAAERDDDPVLSASELRRRQRTIPSPQVTVRSVRQSAELPVRSSSHVSRLFGNIILLVLILCICLLLIRRLCIVAGCL